MPVGPPSPLLLYPPLASDLHQHQLSHAHIPDVSHPVLSLHASFTARLMQSHSPPSLTLPTGQTKRKGSSSPQAHTADVNSSPSQLRAGERKHLRNDHSAAATVAMTATQTSERTARPSPPSQLLIPHTSLHSDSEPVPMMISPRSAQNLVPAFNMLPVAAPTSPTQPASAPPMSSLHFPLDSLPRPLVSSASADLLSLPFSSSSTSAFHTLTPRKVVVPTFSPLAASSASPPLFLRPPMPPAAAPLAMPDAKAFEREASIEKKRRSKRKSALPATSSAASPPRHNGAPITPAIAHAPTGRFAVPVARERPHPPSTPMKTPASARDAGVSIVFRSPYVAGKTPAVVGGAVYVPPSPLSSRASQHIRTLPCTPSRPLFQPIVDELVADSTDNSAASNAASTDAASLCSTEPPASASFSVASSTVPSTGSSFLPAPLSVSNASYFSSNFTLISELGRGDFGIVYLCRWHADNALYAVKKSLKPLRTAAERQRACREINHFVSLTTPSPSTSSSEPATPSSFASPHPNLLCYYQAWLEESHLYIQTEYLSAGTLRDAIDRSDDAISEDRIWDWAAQILSGLAFLHQRAVLHLDVKPDNVFVGRDGVLKVGDLGTSVREGGGQEGREEVEEGDAVYIAPELLDGTIGAVSAKADVFSLGLTLFEIAADVILPTRGEAWNELRMEKLDWNGSTYFLSDSPVSLCSPEMRQMAGSGVNAAAGGSGAGRRSPLTCISPIVMEKGVYAAEEKEVAATVDGAQHRRSFTPVNTVMPSLPVAMADSVSDVFLSPLLTSNHPPTSGAGADDDEDGVRTPHVRPQMRTRSTPLSALQPSPSLPPSAYDSPATTARPLSFHPTTAASATTRPPSAPRASSPFADDSLPSIPTLKRRRSSVISAGAGAARSARLKAVVSAMLRRDPALRPSVAELLAQPNIEYALERRRQMSSLVRVEESGSERAPRQLFTNKAAVL